MYKRKREKSRLGVEQIICKPAGFKLFSLVNFPKWKLFLLIPLLPIFLFSLQFSETDLQKKSHFSSQQESKLQDYSTKRTLSEKALCIKETLVSLPFAKNNNFTQTLQKTSVRQFNINAFKASIAAVNSQLQTFFKHYCKKKTIIAKVIPHHIDYYIFSLCKITT